ncbi:MAG: RNA 3'-terminal phosphate cyclase [bacterium]|nr:RNA 3'-terminal phosphate cyclase [bacterium]
MSTIIEIDDSYWENGGQILRTALSFSAITKKPCRIFNIRKPGLTEQHLLSLRALSLLCDGRLEGNFLGSNEIEFYPDANYQYRISINIPTAGSIVLVLQTLIPPALCAKEPIKITFNGGATDTFFSPTIDYFRYVFLRILEKMGAKIEIDILKRGYYPEGGAKAEVKIYPSVLKGLKLTERGSLKKIVAISGAAESLRDKKTAERQLAGVREVLGKLKLPIEERVEYYPTQCPGSQICLIGEFENTIIGTDNLGKLGERAEDVGKKTALELLNEQKTNSCLDKHLADQILPYMALASGKSQATVSEITNYCKANIWVIEKFLGGKFIAENNTIIWRGN